jgi:hypothetical protein
MDDLWKKELFMHSTGNLFNLRSKNYDKVSQPILHNIALSFEKFSYKFTATNENYKKAFIFENPCITFDLNRTHFLQKTFFTNEEWNLYGKNIEKLSMDSLLTNGNIVSKNTFEINTGILISDLKYQKLRGMALTAVAKYGKVLTIEKKN